MELDGIITFMSLYQALRAERVLQKAGIAARTVPAPRDLSPTCVTAIRFPWSAESRVGGLLEAGRIDADRICHYPELPRRAVNAAGN